MSLLLPHPRFQKRRRIVAVKMPSRDTRLEQKAETTIHRVASHALTVVKNRVLTKLDYHVSKVAFAKRTDEDTLSEKELRSFVDSLNDDVLDWGPEAREELRSILAAVAKERSTVSLDSLSEYLGDDELAKMLTQANTSAVAWARDRIGNLITEVSHTTRDAVNEMTATAIESGWTSRELADELDDAWEFGADRAMMIARTEPTFAESAGALIGYRESGVVEGKGWSAEDPCDECQANEDDGIIDLDEQFSSGDDAPPAHPNCKCAVYAAVSLEE